MKQFFLILVVATLAQAAHAKTLNFDCRTQTDIADEGKIRIRFSAAQTATGKINYLDPDAEEIFHATPKDAKAQWLNTNGSIRQDKNKVTFFGDGDGFVLVYLTLYRNSGLTTGYLRYKDLGEGLSGNLYAKIGCKVTEFRN